MSECQRTTAAYMFVEPASYYHKIMTRAERMPVLSERVLWDADYDDDDLQADHPPEVAELVTRTGGIPDGYFTAIVHEPRDDEVVTLFERLKSLAD